MMDVLLSLKPLNEKCLMCISLPMLVGSTVACDSFYHIFWYTYYILFAESVANALLLLSCASKAI